MMNDGQVSAVSARGRSAMRDAVEPSSATVIVNADDWGRDVLTTDRSLNCVLQGAVSSVSAMVFMEDSERAADLARQHGVDAGLHLNFTLPYSAPQCPPRLMERQEKIARFLTGHRLASVIYHPGLASSFEYVVKMQLEEYERLYGAPANRFDGHHHMHLCANVARQELIPSGTIVRRNLSFGSGEKGYFNRFYRRRQDRRLARRHRLTDFFFDLKPLEPRQRLAGILELATRFDIEVETHPIRDGEYSFLMNGELLRGAEGVGVSCGYILRFGNSSSGKSRFPLAQQAWR
jgi:hypothetical protein